MSPVAVVALLLVALCAASEQQQQQQMKEYLRAVIQPPYYLITVPAEFYILPLLPYDYDQLEPQIEQSTVRAHYFGHHENYRNKMNSILALWRLEEPDNSFSKQPILNIFKQLDEVPAKYRLRLKNNAGGFINHAIYWAVMSPNPNGTERFPSASLTKEIEESFENYYQFHLAFTNEAINLFGSGYVWLVRDHKKEPGKQLSVVITKDQDSPITQDLDPLLVLDVWEHAYYLKHQYKRGSYIDDWWLLVDWQAVDKLDQFWKHIRNPVKEEL